MVPTSLGPDEQVYVAQAKAFRAGKFLALRDLADEFAEEPSLKQLPSPLRWLWAVMSSGTMPVSQIALQVVCGALMGPAAWLLTHSSTAAVWAAASPLVLTLARRRLQDVPVALTVLAAIGLGQAHSTVGVAVALFVALSIKEAAMLSVPAVAAAWLVSGGSAGPLVVALAAGVAAWVIGLLAVFGRRAIPLFRAATSGHSTNYGSTHQAGAPHRLLVDLALASPCAVLFATLGASQAPTLTASLLALLAFHAAAPIRNVRFVLAADILIRAIGASAMSMPFLELPAVLAVDAYIAWRIRHVYDPVTHELATALGMPAVSANK
jgi:hypothetical protein